MTVQGLAEAIIDTARTVTIRNGEVQTPEEHIQQMIEADRAAIRKESADRAVRWCEKWADESWAGVTKNALRAAIEGGHDA